MGAAVMRRSPRPTARCLCTGCGLRFSSTRAFDAHRSFALGHKGDWSSRVCLDPAEAKGFESTEGICRLTGETVSVRIWALTEHRNQARQIFRRQDRPALERAAGVSQTIRRNAGRDDRRAETAASVEREELPAAT